MATKITVTVDDVTVARLNRAAARTGKAKSAVIREAVRDYEARTDRMSTEEQQRMLAVMHRMAGEPPSRPQREVERELAEIRRARRQGGRRHRVE
ncbi:MAG TPA: ribbon-helix-helix protein, CopG family [Terriglobales bacterium]|jgi:metal-responsive CopG/Arc/MetJ family transcriptional regulator